MIWSYRIMFLKLMSHGVSIIYDTQQVDYRKVSSEKNKKLFQYYIVQTRKRRLKVWKLLQVYTSS